MALLLFTPIARWIPNTLEGTSTLNVITDFMILQKHFFLAFHTAHSVLTSQSFFSMLEQYIIAESL